MIFIAAAAIGHGRSKIKNEICGRWTVILQNLKLINLPHPGEKDHIPFVDCAAYFFTGYVFPA
jgi:hypothetical protein